MHAQLDDLARTYGLAVASDLPPRQARPTRPDPVRSEYVDETPKRTRRTPQEMAAEEELGWHWVTVLTTATPILRAPGDNLGTLPLWIESNSDWRQSGVAFDRQQPMHRAIRLMVIGVRSAAHAAMLKGHLDEAIHGRELEVGATELRHRFRNAAEFGAPADWLTPVLADALIRCELQATSFELFTRSEHDRAVSRIAARMIAEG